MKEVKLEEDIQEYFTGNRLMGAIQGLPRASTGAIQIPPSQLLKVASWSSQMIELYTKQVFSLNPAFKHTLSDYFQCFKRCLKLVMSTKQQGNEKEKDHEDQQIKLMMFLMMTGLPKFDYELYGFQCQTTQTSNCSHASKESLQQEDNQNEQHQYSEEGNDRNEEAPNRDNDQRPETEKAEKDNPSEEKSSYKSSQSEQRSKLIRKPGRPKKRKYYFSKKTQ